MRGSVVKRAGGYSVVLDLGRGPNGKRIRRWHSGYKTKRDAERARVELLAKLDQGAYIPPSKLTVAAFLVDQWLPSVRAQVKASTWGWHRTNVVNHLVPRVGQVLLQKLSPGHLNEAYAGLREAGWSRGPCITSTRQRGGRWRMRSGGGWWGATSPAWPALRGLGARR